MLPWVRMTLHSCHREGRQPALLKGSMIQLNATWPGRLTSRDLCAGTACYSGCFGNFSLPDRHYHVPHTLAEIKLQYAATAFRSLEDFRYKMIRGGGSGTRHQARPAVLRLQKASCDPSTCLCKEFALHPGHLSRLVVAACERPLMCRQGH